MINFLIKDLELILESYNVVFMGEVFNISWWHLVLFNKMCAVFKKSIPQMCPIPTTKS